MKVLDVSSLAATERQVDCPKKGFVSNRILLRSDGMGYSLTKTEIPKGDWQNWHYKHHYETCYCLEGRGILHDIVNDTKYYIYPGIVYILDNHDKHAFKALEDTVLLCIFTPPLVGLEVHKEDGSYSI